MHSDSESEKVLTHKPDAVNQTHCNKLLQK